MYLYLLARFFLTSFSLFDNSNLVTIVSPSVCAKPGFVSDNVPCLSKGTWYCGLKEEVLLNSYEK